MKLKLMRLQSYTHAQFPTNPIYKGDVIEVDAALGEKLLTKGTNTGHEGEFLSYFDKCPDGTPARYTALPKVATGADVADPNKVTLTRAEYEALLQASKPARPVMEDAGGDDTGETGGDGGDGGEGGESEGEETGGETTPAAKTPPRPTQRAAAKTAARRGK